MTESKNSPSPPEGPRKIDYLEGFRFLFRDPNWGNNLLLGSLFTIIPIVGPLVLMGWYCEIFQRFVKRHPKPIPRLDFNDFVYYLGRGVNPFVVALIVTLPIIFIMMIVMFVVFFAIGFVFSQSPPQGPVLPIVSVLGGIMLFFLFMLPLVILSNSALTRAYLMEDIGGALNVKKILGYAQRTWKSLLLAYVIYLPLVFLLMFAGMLALYFGIFPASFLANLAWIYLAWQIYEQYLSEGGEPIPLKANVPPVPSEQRQPAAPTPTT